MLDDLETEQDISHLLVVHWTINGSFGLVSRIVRTNPPSSTWQRGVKGGEGLLVAQALQNAGYHLAWRVQRISIRGQTSYRESIIVIEDALQTSRPMNCHCCPGRESATSAGNGFT